MATETSSESFLLLSVTNDEELTAGEALAPPSQTQLPSQQPPPAPAVPPPPAAAAAPYYDAPPSSFPPPYSSVITPYPQHEQPPAYTSCRSSSEQTGASPRLDLVPLLCAKRLQQVNVIGTEHYPQPTVSVNDEIWHHVSAADAIPDPVSTTSAAYNGVYNRDLTPTTATGGNATTVTFVRRHKKKMGGCTAVCGICILLFYIFRFSLSLSRY